MEFNETAKAIGFRDGDVLISADGVPFERYGGDMLTSVVDARQVTVRRDGQEVSVYIPEKFYGASAGRQCTFCLIPLSVCY